MDDLHPQGSISGTASTAIILLVQNLKKPTMKTIMMISAVFILQINSLFASYDGVPAKVNKEMNFSAVLTLAPTTPKEATFEEMAPVAELLISAPVTPKEATFGDEAEDIILISFASVTPKEATFEDEDEDPINPNLAPVTPAEADFSDLPK
jgi:hypothetical protein